jgi:hypothetical protein
MWGCRLPVTLLSYECLGVLTRVKPRVDQAGKKGVDTMNTVEGVHLPFVGIAGSLDDDGSNSLLGRPHKGGTQLVEASRTHFTNHNQGTPR